MNWNLLQKYLSGECDPEEVQQIERWLHASPENRAFMDTLEKVGSVYPDDEIEVDVKANWEAVQHKITGNAGWMDGRKGSDNSQLWRRPAYINSQKSNRNGRSWMYALSAAAVILIALLFLRKMPSTQDTPRVQKQTAMRLIETDAGQRITFRLSDGTRVQLNAGSQVKVSQNFGDSTRVVYMEGEAYFHVASDPERPFIVHSGSAYTRVLGTKFGVKHYPEDDQVRVIVEEGKVAVGFSDSAGDAHHLTRNQMSVLSDDGTSRVLAVADIRTWLGWKDGNLIFDDAPFTEVKQKLERWYDITISVEGSPELDSQRLTASFRDEPLSEVLSLITYSFGLEFIKEGQTITLYKGVKTNSD